MARERVPANPPPKRNPRYQALEDIVWVQSKGNAPPYDSLFNERQYSPEAVLYKAQYFAIEGMLLQSFEFVAPGSRNAATYSVKFASMIKDACNVFEIVCRDIYRKFYDVPEDAHLNILNFLSLERFLDLSKIRLVLVSTLDRFPDHPEIVAPFTRLAQLPPEGDCSKAVPEWWNAYNRIKHSNDGFPEFATLATAIASLSGLFCVLNRVYGTGFVYGMASLPDLTLGFLPNARSSLLFSPE
jgi:hypothetical protein